MNVLDEEPYRWHLLEEDGTLFLNAFCSNSAVDYYFLVQLNDDELSAYREKGRSYLDRLSYDIHYSAAGVRGSKSKYKARGLTPTRGDEAMVAIRAWDAQRSASGDRTPADP